MKIWPDNQDKNKWYYSDVQEATNLHKYYKKDKEIFEIWDKLLPIRDWEAFEKIWSKSKSSTNPGDIIK